MNISHLDAERTDTLVNDSKTFMYSHRTKFTFPPHNLHERNIKQFEKVKEILS